MSMSDRLTETEERLFIDKLRCFELLKDVRRCLCLIGNPVKVGSGPAAVIGYEICIEPLSGFNRVGRNRE